MSSEWWSAQRLLFDFQKSNFDDAKDAPHVLRGRTGGVMTHKLSWSVTERTPVIVVLMLLAVPAGAEAQTPNLASAETFGVLVAATVANAGTTTVNGDVGVGPGGTITGPAITVDEDSSIHEGDAAAAQALLDASEVFDALGALPCTMDLSGQNLGGQSLAPGVYCFAANATLSGAPLTLTGTGPWIFKVTGALTTSASVDVSGSTQDCDGSSVFWRVGGSSGIGAATAFVGNLLSQTGAIAGADASIDGRLIGIGASSAIALNGNTINACSFGRLLPLQPAFKVTGGGQIGVPEPDSPGVSSYGFNAKPASASVVEDHTEADPKGRRKLQTTGHLNYLNHVTGLHIDGAVTDLDVVTLDIEGKPKMVRFSGTCADGPDCTFSVTVEDNGEPSVNDRFGIAVVGSSADETTSDRVVRRGNIQFHGDLTVSLNARNFGAGDTMTVSASLSPGGLHQLVDAYLVLMTPDGQLLSWTANGPVHGIVPIARNIRPVGYRGVVASFTIPRGAPRGTYVWLSVLTVAGTMEPVSEIAQQRFAVIR
jgi:hypothetical protein